jgi:hypothetical protein
LCPQGAPYAVQCGFGASSVLSCIVAVDVKAARTLLLGHYPATMYVLIPQRCRGLWSAVPHIIAEPCSILQAPSSSTHHPHAPPHVPTEGPVRPSRVLAAKCPARQQPSIRTTDSPSFRRTTYVADRPRAWRRSGSPADPSGAERAAWRVKLIEESLIERTCA